MVFVLNVQRVWQNRHKSRVIFVATARAKSIFLVKFVHACEYNLDKSKTGVIRRRKAKRVLSRIASCREKLLETMLRAVKRITVSEAVEAACFLSSRNLGGNDDE